MEDRKITFKDLVYCKLSEKYKYGLLKPKCVPRVIYIDEIPTFIASDYPSLISQRPVFYQTHE